MSLLISEYLHDIFPCFSVNKIMYIFILKYLYLYFYFQNFLWISLILVSKYANVLNHPKNDQHNQ